MALIDTTLAIIPSVPGWGELLIVAFIGLLLFGRRLPEVGRSLGKGIVEFKKGLRGIEDDVEDSVNRSTDRVLPKNSYEQQNTPNQSGQPDKQASEVHSGH